jgi:hypothetical protein
MNNLKKIIDSIDSPETGKRLIEESRHNYKDDVVLKTVFGKVKIVYNTKEEIDWKSFSTPDFSPGSQPKTKKGKTGYRAQILDGVFKGWNAWWITREGALSKLMKDVSSRYVSDLLRKAKIY